MTTAVQPAGGGGGGGGGKPSPTGLADVIDSILDKGLVIDAYVRVSLVGIELVTIDARVVIASVDTYLRLDISQDKEGLPGLVGDMQEGGARKKSKGAAQGVLDAAGSKLRDFAENGDHEPARSRRGKED